MQKIISPRNLAIVIALLAGANTAQALVPWSGASNSVTTPDLIVYTAGGATEDKAIAGIVYYLAQSGTVDVFQDYTSATARKNGSLTTVNTNGGNFNAWYFTGGANAAGLIDQNGNSVNLQGKHILFVKRSLGSAGYGVIPLIKNYKLDNLNVLNTAATDWTSSGTTHTVLFSSIQSNPGKYLVQVDPQGGFSGVDAPALLNPGTWNYPQPVNEPSTGSPVTSSWPTNLGASSLSKLVRIPSGGFGYGIAVTSDLYQVLQAAQVADGSLTLPGGHNIGSYVSEADLPSLSSNFVAAALAGNVLTWDSVTNRNGTALTSSTLIGTNSATQANIALPGLHTVAVGIRNQGSALGAVAYSTAENLGSVTK